MTEISINTSIIFDTDNVRIVGTYEEPWFIAKDICKKLGLANTTMALKKIPEKNRGSIRLSTPSGDHETNIVNESGLYNLIMRSNKPEAEKFREWLCEDVIPSLRKKGKYELDKELQQKILEHEISYKQSLLDKEQKISEQKAQLKKLNKLLKRREKRKFQKGHCLYVVKNPDIQNKFKLGMTKNMNERLENYTISSPHEYEVLYHRLVPDTAMSAIEDIALFALDKFRCETDLKASKKREWLEVDSGVICREIDAICDFVISRRKVHDSGYELDSETKSDPEPVSTEPTKVCDNCSEEKVLDAFYKREENVDGYENLCKKCFVQRQLKARKARTKVPDLQSETKTCSKCQEDLPKTMYRRHPKSKDGYVATCNNCYAPQVIDRTEKVCAVCRVAKPMSEYNNCRTSADGKFAYCRPCNILKNKQYRDKIRT